MAVDEAISESVRKDLSPPTLRLYQWSEPSVSIGYFQKTSDINIEYCRKKHYPLVRRATGGTLILHDSELTYCFYARSDLDPFKGGLIENYNAISYVLLRAFKMLKLNAEISLQKRPQRNPLCFKTSSYGEITVNGQKIIGSAQKRYKNVFLQHGSMPFSFDSGELHRVLSCQNQSGDYPEIGTINKYAPSVTVTGLKEAIKNAFEHTFRIKFTLAGSSDFELKLAKKLEAEKYSTNEWNYRR